MAYPVRYMKAVLRDMSLPVQSGSKAQRMHADIK